MTKYELDHMPETAAGKRMYSRVSPVYESSLFMKRFYDALGGQWDKLREFFTTLREQHFIDTVDWGIRFLEYKYSLEPRPDLTLEERRARLGIKARTHRPLNPAVMEQHIRDAFGLETYLDEGTPGYLRVIMNHLTQDGWKQMIPWLIKEKPAHLVLGALIYIVIYTGETPLEPAESRRVILPGKLPLPKTPAEKKLYPRISVGNPLLVDANVRIGLRTPKGSITRPKVAGVHVVDGNLSLGLRLPKSSKVVLRVGGSLRVFGSITLGGHCKHPHA